jgi:hypothetical protein
MDGGYQTKYAIDVGGERFLLNKEKSIDLAFKGKKAFMDIYQPVSKNVGLSIDRVMELFQKYLPVDRKSSQPFLFPAGGSKDREDLLKVLQGRIEQISETRIYTIRNTNLIHIFNNLVELVEHIEKGRFSGKSKKQRKPLTENEIFSLIFEFSWYLMHPNMEMNDDWEGMVKKLDRISLDGLVREIAEEEKKQGVEPPKTPLNYFKNIDLKNVIRQPTKEKSMDRIKQMILFPHSEEGKGMKKLLQNLMAILAMKKFIEPPEYRESLPVIKVSDLDRIKSHMPEQIVKGGAEEEKKETAELSSSLGKAMMPFFDYFQAMYDPIYDFIAVNVDEFEKANPTMDRSKFITECLHLLYLCTHLPATENGIPKGIYRINKVDPVAQQWVSFILGQTTAHIDSLTEEEYKEDFKGQLYKLPIFKLTTFKHGSALKSYTNPDTLPYVQFMMLGHNVSKRTDKNFMEQSAALVKEYEALQSFFEENVLYLVVSDSTLSSNTQTPMNLFDIDYSMIQLDKPLVEVTPYQPKSESSGKPPMLEQVMSVKETTFNNGELILCILQLLKKQMPH